jgi:hypothetical protein
MLLPFTSTYFILRKLPYQLILPYPVFSFFFNTIQGVLFFAKYTYSELSFHNYLQFIFFSQNFRHQTPKNGSSRSLAHHQPVARPRASCLQAAAAAASADQEEVSRYPHPFVVQDHPIFFILVFVPTSTSPYCTWHTG